MRNLLEKVTVTTIAGTVLALGTIANSAEAATFNFSYTLQSGDILSGMLEGEVQADEDTVIVSEISMPSLNGVLGPELSFAESFVGIISTLDFATLV